MTRRSRVQPPQRGGTSDDDGGFTIIEVTVAIALVTIVMTALAAFFVNSAGATDNQGQRQLAVQIGTDAMERARSVSGIGLLHLRDKQSSDVQWQRGLDTSATAPFPGVAPLLANVTEAYDTTTGLAANAGYDAQLPTDGNAVVLDNRTFTQNWFVGNCYASPLVNGGACSGTAVAGATLYYQVVVAVTWNDKACRNSQCSYVSVTRISPTPDPLFDANQSAPKPKITNPGNQVDDVTQTQALTLQLTGGTAPVVWSATNLPHGLSLVTTATNASITGTPDTVNAAGSTVVVKVVDAFGFVSTAAFTWKIYPLPVLTPPGNQVSTRNGTVNLPLTLTGGAPTVTYSASGLPAGLSINSTTGVISGSPTTTNTSGSAVSVTATDNTGGSDVETFTWRVNSALTVTTPGTQYANVSGPDLLAMTAGGGTTPYRTWTATGLPAGFTIDASSGMISGTPTTTCTCSVTVSVSDSGGASATTSAFTWQVYPALTVTTPATRSNAVNSAITAFTPTVTGSGSYTWSATGVPTGIAMSATTGAFTGKPTQGGRYLTTITVVDTKSGNVATTNITWTITGGVAITLNTVDPITGRSNTTITPFAPTATLNGAPASFTWSASSLPTGVSINSSSGVISGKPTAAGVYTVTVTASTTKNGTTSVGNYMLTWTVT